MSEKPTNLLRDDPSTSDEFGPHGKIADLICEEIVADDVGRSIAVVGDWGSGKSMIIRLIESNFYNGGQKKPDVQVFIYDAWAHQGDSLRRAFLDDLIAFLKKKGWLTGVESEKASELIWNRTETTITEAEPILRRHAKILLLTVALLPLGLKLFDVGPYSTAHDLAKLSSPLNWFALLLILAPVIALGFFGVVRSITFPAEVRSEFEARLRAASKREGLAPQTVQNISDVAGILGIDLASEVLTSESEANPPPA